MPYVSSREAHLVPAKAVIALAPPRTLPSNPLNPPAASGAASEMASRSNSTTTPVLVTDQALSRKSSKHERTSSRAESPQMPPPSPKKKPPQYTVFIRLPFPRGAFEDPPPVEWDATKDRKLWKHISGSHVGKGDLDWEGLSHEFGVDLSFLLMQAAWLSERHMERMRRQVGRIAGAQTEGTGSATGSAVKMERTTSRDSKMPPSSITTTRRGSPSFPVGPDVAVSPGSSTPQPRATISRTPSTATVTQSKLIGSTTTRLTTQAGRTARPSSGSGRKPAYSAQGSPRDEYYEDALEHEGPLESDSEEEPSAMARSQAFRRPPMNRKIKQTLGTLSSEGDAEEDEDEDDSSGGYLPFANASKQGKPDPAATVRESPRPTTEKASRPATAREESGVTTTTESSASSASSAMYRRTSSDAATTNDPSNQPRRRTDQPPGPLSPRHRAQLASVSPRVRVDGSEGSPSMGSSFSDLDDASVTQSALEDALLSNMRQGGNGYGSSMASRVSSIRDALGRRNQ